MALEFYQILETSDVPAGVVNIITGDKNELAQVLADHYEVESVCVPYFFLGSYSYLANMVSVYSRFDLICLDVSSS